MRFTRLVVLSLALALPARAATDNKFLVAASSSSGAYSQMLNEVMGMCPETDTGITISEVPGLHGAPDNLDALANNAAIAAFLHSDVYKAKSQSDPKYSNLFTLVPLYAEEVHVLAQRVSTVKKGGIAGVGAKVVEFNTLADLKGYTVAAAGGGCYTAGILTQMANGGFTVSCLDKGDDVYAALDKGEAQAAIFVGGSPVKKIAELPKDKYKLIPIPESMASAVKTVYNRATIDYPNLKSGAIDTLAAQAVILTRKYRIPAIIAKQAAFRRCFYDHLIELQDTPGMHMKWQAVEPEEQAAEHSLVPWYEIPATTPPLSAAPSAPPPAPPKTR